MFYLIIFFMLGDVTLQQFPRLPSNITLYSLCFCSVLFCIIFKKHYWVYIVLAYLLGMTYANWYAHQRLAWVLTKEKEGVVLKIKGTIASLPNQGAFGRQFEFYLQELQFNHAIEKPRTVIRLFWPNQKNQLNQPLKVGDEWQLLVKLKRLHHIESPGAFDFEAWALQNGLRASGAVIPSLDNQKRQHTYSFLLNQLRQIIKEKMTPYLPRTQTSAWLISLLLGDRSGLTKMDWQILRNTGTNHLVAIAGLHIGIIAGLMYAVIAWLWRRIPHLCLHYPATKAAALGMLFTAIVYSALAGFALPTQRALIMLASFTCVTLNQRQTRVWYSWSLSMLIILMFNPLDVLSESFWLSFGTLALIFYGMQGRLAVRGWWWKWGRVQWVIGIGLIPLTLILFQQISLISFIANSIAIPFLGFIILPILLISILCVSISSTITLILLKTADKCIYFLWSVLSYFSHLPYSVWHHAIPTMTLSIITIAGILLLLLPSGFPGKWFGLFWLCPLFFYPQPKPLTGDIWLSLLDVGQGLSVVVQTKEHTLIYDTGANNGSMDMGESVVLPYLNLLNVKDINMLVISHGDNDHLGGAQTLLNNFKINTIFTSVPQKINAPSQYCLQGMHWEWDGVKFTFLYPTFQNLHFNNDSSCVLKIDNGLESVLLPGDIEKNAEESLIKNNFVNLNSTMLIAPHHGSKTSGLLSFIEAVHPLKVFYSTGYRNRYHFPHPSVIRTYNALSIPQWNTAETGTILYKIEKNAKTLKHFELYRFQHKRYWYDV